MEAPLLTKSTMTTQESLFSSSLVHVYIGKDPKLFYVHKDILAQFPLFLSRIQEGPDGLSITDTRASVRAFDLALHWLYGQPFDELKPYLAITNVPGTTDADTLQPACELLCIAIQYALIELENALSSYFLDAGNVSYQCILAAAKYVYTKAPTVNPWFENYIQERSQEALTGDPNLADETWFMKIFEHGNSGLSKHLFLCYKNWCKSLHTEILTPISENDRSVDLENHARSEQSNSAAADINQADKAHQLEKESLNGEMAVLPKEELPKELPIAWDHGLDWKMRKRKEKRMKLDGTWHDRITQDMVDTAAAEAATAERDLASEAELEASAMPEPEVETAPSPPAAIEPEPEPATVPEPELEMMEEKQPWDFDLSPKERRKKQKRMQLEGTWETRLTQGMIDEEIAAAAAAKHIEGEGEVEPLVEPELEPEPEPVVEEHDTWDFGDLNSSKSKTKKKKSLFEPELELRSEPVPQAEEVAPEDRDPWGFGSKTKKNKKDKRELYLEIDPSLYTGAELEAFPVPVPEPEPEPESVPEPVPEPESEFSQHCACLACIETDPNDQEVNTSRPNTAQVAPQEELADDAWGFSSHTRQMKKSKKAKKRARPVIEFIPEPEPEFEPTTEPPPEPEWEPAEHPQEHNHGFCVNRSEHLLEATQWQACPICLGEVIKLARVLADL